jgi:hypothetical protein
VQVTTLSAWQTPYGVTLLVKLALVLPLLGLGALNLCWVRPRLAREARAGDWLRRLVTGEALLVVGILGATGVLTSLEPARHVAAQQGRVPAPPLTVEDMVEGVHITLTITPGWVGPNRLRVMLRDRRERPVWNATQVELRLEAQDADLGAQTALATARGAGLYELDGALFSLAGPWQIQLVVRQPDAFDARTAWQVTIPASGAGGQAGLTLAPRTGTVLWGGAPSRPRSHSAAPGPRPAASCWGRAARVRSPPWASCSLSRPSRHVHPESSGTRGRRQRPQWRPASGSMCSGAPSVTARGGAGMGHWRRDCVPRPPIWSCTSRCTPTGTSSRASMMASQVRP